MYRRSVAVEPHYRFLTTLVSAFCGAAIGAMWVSPWFIHQAASSKDPDSLLRREMARIAVTHNPNRAMEVVAAQRLAEVHQRREQEKRQQELQMNSTEGGDRQRTP